MIYFVADALAVNDKQSADGILTITFKPLLEGVFKMTPMINGIALPGSPINICISMRSLLSRMRQDVQVDSSRSISHTLFTLFIYVFISYYLFIYLFILFILFVLVLLLL
jgi:hypothetical protein